MTRSERIRLSYRPLTRAFGNRKAGTNGAILFLMTHIRLLSINSEGNFLFALLVRTGTRKVLLRRLPVTIDRRRCTCVSSFQDKFEDSNSQIMMK